jgi:hypothetical protein
MTTEIGILTGLDHARNVVVEKATNVLWTPDDLETVRDNPQYQHPDTLRSAEDEVAVSNPFPGCLQQFSALEENYHYQLVGQTRHFLVFQRPDAA